MSTPRFEHGGSDLWSNTLSLDHGGTLVVVRVDKKASFVNKFQASGSLMDLA